MSINENGLAQPTGGSALAWANGQTQKINSPERVVQPPFSVFSQFEKGLYIYIASVAAFASPVSSSIYYPAMNSLAEDLHTSLTNISLTITTYLIFQGISPTIIGGYSDRYGRRPASLLCFTIFAAANIGLALQTDYAALLVLRCLQSAGSSGTTVISSAVVSDLATRQERGSYIGLAALGSSLGPALGPIIGGLLDHFLGWRAIFWFLAIYAGVMSLIYLVFIPETCRNIVGNGSVPPQYWNKPAIQYAKDRRKEKENRDAAQRATMSKKQRPGLLSSIPILFQKESFLILIYGAFLYSGYIMILTGLPQQLSSTYNYNSIQVGLCYIPIGVGPILIRPIVGRIMDANFRRYTRKSGIATVDNNVQQDIDNLPIERIRLEISLAFVYITSIAILPYGWVMGLQKPPLPAVLVMLFIMGLCTSASVQPLTALIIDINPKSPAAGGAAFNLVRCLLAAGGAAIVNPLLNSIGRGWTGTLVALSWIVLSVCWWAVIILGPKWRKQARKAESKRETA